MPFRKPLRQAENVREFDDAGTDRTTTDAVMFPTKEQRKRVPRFAMVGNRATRTGAGPRHRRGSRR